MLLKELFKKELPFVKKEHPVIDEYSFETSSGQHITMKLYKVSDFRQAGVDMTDSGIGFDFKNDSENGTEEITGTGDAVEIFSTVINILRKEINKRKPNLIGFGAHEKSRQKLYDRIIKRMSKEFPEYSLIENPPVKFSLGNSKYYLLQKNK